jgi:hypothetical protein
MKKLLLLSLLLASQIASANCNLRTASILENDHKVGPVTGLAKRFSAEVGRCAVSYQINVDGEDHLVVYSANGPEREDVLCGYAVERGRRELLLTLGGQFKTQANLVCEEGKAVKQKIQIGDTILENEVDMNARLNFYWPYKEYAKCRMFKERYVQNKAPVEYNGVICQKNTNDLWLVVDKW